MKNMTHNFNSEIARYDLYTKVKRILNPRYYDLNEKDVCFGKDYILKYKGQTYETENLYVLKIEQKKDESKGLIDTIVDFMYNDYLFYLNCLTNKGLNSKMYNITRVLNLHLNLKIESVNSNYGAEIKYKDYLGYQKKINIKPTNRNYLYDKPSYYTPTEYDKNLNIKKMFYLIFLRLLDSKMVDELNITEDSLW